MYEYEVDIWVKLQATVTVIANSEEEAEKMAKERLEDDHHLDILNTHGSDLNEVKYDMVMVSEPLEIDED